MAGGQSHHVVNSPDAGPRAVPPALRRWFIAHFMIDLLFALPLMIAPVWLLTLFGWQQVDPFTARLAAAALFGIGIESWLGRNASPENYRQMLNLKVIWSLAAVAGILTSILQGAQGRPAAGWGVLAIFAIFNLVWVYWRVRLGREA
jgi:hypothetical protein